MTKHTASFLVTTLVAVCTMGIAQPGQPMNLEDLVREAVANNPQLRAARHQTAAAQTKVDQASAWEAPQVGVVMYQTPIQSFPNPFKNGMETDYYIQQMFPFPGKRSAMGDAALNGASMTEQNYHTLEQKIVRGVKDAYDELYLVQRKIEVNAANQDLMRKFVAIASKQYEVGKGSQADVLRGQTELSSLLAGMVTLRQELGVARSMMNTLLYRPVDAPLGDVPEIERAMPAWTFEQLRPLALENRPELKGMQYSLAMSTADLSAAKREYWPDLMVQVMYKDMAMTRNDFWSTMIGVSIPVAPWASGKVTSKEDEEELNVKRAEEDLAAMSSMVLFDVQDALAQVRSNEEIDTLDKTTVIPQAEQTMISTQAAYATGKTDFLALLDAYKTLLSARLDYYAAVTAFMKSQSQLEQSVGLSIPEITQRVAQ